MLLCPLSVEHYQFPSFVDSSLTQLVAWLLTDAKFVRSCQGLVVFEHFICSKKKKMISFLKRHFSGGGGGNCRVYVPGNI